MSQSNFDRVSNAHDVEIDKLLRQYNNAKRRGDFAAQDKAQDQINKANNRWFNFESDHLRRAAIAELENHIKARDEAAAQSSGAVRK